YGRRIEPDGLRPGDIVFFHASANGPQHEGIYIGAGEFIHAPHSGDVVKVSSLYDMQYALTYVGAVRPYAAGASPSSLLSMWTLASG
ncbi:MAG: NlpC/P60 family protein, partial [Actinobacteria bacterium]